MKGKILPILLGIVIGTGGTLAVMKYTHLSHLLTPMEMGHSMSSDKTDESQKDKKILYWKAPMDPTYIRNEPGKSPMGMDLVPVYEGEEGASEPGTVKIDPVTVQNIGVKTEKAEKRTLTKTIRTVGRIDYNEKKVHRVHTKIEGWV
ncbi:MAG: heavy metal-binding domain-containing protein, partial [Nitrospinota bacterium]